MKVGRASFKVMQCDTMEKLPSPVHAERMKVAPFGSLERFRTEKPVFGSDAREATDVAANEPRVTRNRHTWSTDHTATETVDVEELSEDGVYREITPVESSTQTTNGQGQSINPNLYSHGVLFQCSSNVNNYSETLIQRRRCLPGG